MNKNPQNDPLKTFLKENAPAVPEASLGAKNRLFNKLTEKKPKRLWQLGNAWALAVLVLASLGGLYWQYLPQDPPTKSAANASSLYVAESFAELFDGLDESEEPIGQEYLDLVETI